MLTLYLILAFIVSALTSMAGLPWLLRLSKKRGLYDMPNERKVHHNKIPRIGGMVFFPSVLMATVAVLSVGVYVDSSPNMVKVSTLIVISGVFMIYLIGVIDDVLGLNAKFKFFVQFLAALALPVCDLYIGNLYGLFGIYELPQALAWALTIFMVLLIVNSMNLIDGIDGLSSSLASIALIVFSVLFWAVRANSCAVLAVSLLASVLVFMYYNLFGNEQRGTKTFMGDAGSLILGYTMAFLVIKYSTNVHSQLVDGMLPVVAALTLVLIPVFDLVRVAFTRLSQHKSIFAADKQHLHHLCLGAGMSMRQSLLFIVALQVLFCVINFLLCFVKADINIILLVDIAIFAVAVILLVRNKKSEA